MWLCVLLMWIPLFVVESMDPLLPLGLCEHDERAGALENQFPGQSSCKGSCSRSWNGDLNSWDRNPLCEVIDQCYESWYSYWYGFAECHYCSCRCQQTCRDGVWTDWTPWSQCTERCLITTQGTRERSRECAGQHGTYGADCVGENHNEENCMEQECQQPANVICDGFEVVDSERVICESSPSDEASCTAAGCCWEAGAAVPCFSPPGRHEWVGNNSNWRYIKHLDSPDIWQYVNLTVRFDRSFWVALTDTWNQDPGPSSYTVQYHLEDPVSHAGQICVNAGGSESCGPSGQNDNKYHNWANLWVSWIGGMLTAGYGSWSSSGVASVAIASPVAISSLAVKAMNGHAMVDANPVGFETHWCWPGKTLQPAYTCECAAGWRIDDGEAKCLLSDTLPALEVCHLYARDDVGGGLAQTVLGQTSSACQYEEDWYINFEPTHLTSHYEFVYYIDGYTVLGPNDYPNWLTSAGFGYGIVSAALHKQIYDFDYTTLLHTVEEYDLGDAQRCSVMFNKDTPYRTNTLISCDVNEAYPAGGVQALDGQKYCHYLNLSASTMYELNTWDGVKRRYGNEWGDIPFVERKLCMQVDYQKPTHCTDPDRPFPCTTSLDPCGISAEDRITSTGNVAVDMQDWDDLWPDGGTEANRAGIVEYEAIIYEVQTGGDILPPAATIRETIRQATPIDNIQLPTDLERNAYDIHFTVKDKATNYKECRAVVFHDGTSELLVNPDYQMNGLTATEETDYVWQINNDKVVWRWNRFFYNSWIITHNVLKPMTQDTERWDGLYHQGDGWVPDTGTHNIDGITVGNWYRADDEDYIPLPTDYINDTLAVFDAEQLEVVPSCSDGDKYIMWRRVYDYRQQERIEFCNIYIDSTPPNVEMIGVFYNGEREIMGISHDHFYDDMKLMFDAWDEHSQIQDMLWKLGTTQFGNEVGEGAEAVVKYAKGMPCPDEATCQCPMIGVCAEFVYTLDLNSLVETLKHIGLHNRLYHLTLTVRNVALLSTIKTWPFLVDTSDPEPGVISDGPPGTEKNERDFHTEQLADAHILGAYDHESGIRLYRWAVAEECLAKDQFLTFDHPDAVYVNSTEPFISSIPTGLNRWVVSAVAINNVMELSEVICSDGVSVDTTPTIITEILVRGASVKPGLACFNGSTWMIWQNRTKQLIPSTSACDAACVGVADMAEMLTVRTVPGDLSSRADELCTIYDIYQEAGLSLMRDTLHMEWEFIEEESGVNEFELGVSKAADNTEAPEVIGYISTHSKYHIVLRHAGLAHGETVFLHLKVRNKAGLVGTETIGPVHIDETAPVVTIPPSVAVTTNTVCLSWTTGQVYDGESGVRTYDIAIGTEIDPEEMLSFREIVKWDECNDGDVGVQLPTRDIQIHDGEARKSYVFTVKAYNGAGMFTLWPTLPFQVPSMYLTSKGILKDVDPDKRDDVFVSDIDYTFNTAELCFRRSGFNHPSSEIAFELGVGSGGPDNAADLVAYHAVSNEESQYCITAPPLVHLTHYFGLLRATTDSGVVEQHSDGMYFIDSTTELSTAQVHDGEGCFNARTVYSSNPGSVPVGGTVQESLSLMLGLWYTVELVIMDSPNLPQNEHIAEIEFTFGGVLATSTQIYHEDDGKRHVFAQVFARHAQYDMIIKNNLPEAINIEQLLVKVCEFDAEYERDVNTANVWWNFYFEAPIREHITSYEVGLQEEGAEVMVVGWKSALLQNHYKFLQIDIKPGVQYKSLVRACFASICMPPISSDGFYLAPEAGQPGAITASAVLTYADDSSQANLDISIEWDRFAFDHENAPAMFYAWTLSTHGEVSNDIRDWSTYEGPHDTDTFTVSVSSTHHVFWEQELYVIMEGFTEAGLSSHVSARVDIDEQLDYTGTGRYVYEVDPSTDIDTIIPFLNSSDIGSLIKRVHNIEIDYQQSTDHVTAYVTGTEHHAFRWRLVSDRSVTYQDCFDRDVRCAGYITSNKNYHTFTELSERPAVISGARLFTCVEADSVSIVREPFDLVDNIPALDLCSDGVSIDTTPPIAGNVYFGMSLGGVQTLHTQLYVHWDGFADLDETTIHHSSGIATYIVSIGSAPGSEDIIKRRSLGRVTHKIFTRLNIKSGTTVYAKVEACDQVGLCTAVISSPLLIDSSPPDSDKAFVNVGSFFQAKRGVQCSRFEVHWGGFSDSHSAVLKYELAVGSAIGAQDKLSFMDVPASFYILRGQDIGLQDGQSYSVTIKAINSAHLYSAISSREFVCDDSAPTNGWVWDGIITDWDISTLPEDVDYKRDLNDISFRFGGFVDPESGIEFYEAGFGTAPGMTDIWPMEHVSTNAFIVRHEHLRVGQWYYASVRACNPVMLCILVSSDGILYDDSPPIVGNVYVGFGDHGSHANFLPSPGTISAHWMGFHDPHSGVRNYEFAVGTTPGDTDIIDWNNVHKSSVLSKSGSDVNLPCGPLLYLALRVWNNVALSAVRVSNPFQCDESKPVFIEMPSLDKRGVGIIQDMQMDRSQIRLKWRAEDPESRICLQTILVMTDLNGVVTVDDMELDTDTHIVLPLTLKEELSIGACYKAQIASCNCAGHCTVESIGPLLVDSTPPILGELFEPYPIAGGKYDYNTWLTANPMTWANTGAGSTVTLFINGFADPHSGLHAYYVKFGTDYGLGDISPVVEVPATPDLNQHTFNLPGTMPVNGILYVTVWVQNKVGLISDVGHISFDVLESSSGGGSGVLLEEKHSCTPKTCNEDCTCAPLGQKCIHEQHSDPCSPGSPQVELTLNDGWGLVEDEDSSGNANCLRSWWVINNPNNVAILRFEWTFGILVGEDPDLSVPGDGIFNLLYERIWYDVNELQSAVHCTDVGVRLEDAATYLSYVRVWYSESEYSEHVSDGILLDQTVPQIGTGRVLTDMDNAVRTEDQDFSTVSDQLHSRWEQIFSETGSEMRVSEYSYGTKPGGDDVVNVVVHDDGNKLPDVGSNSQTGLVLISGQMYTASIRGYNINGFGVRHTSDGITIDADPPIAGVVYNGNSPHNVDFQPEEDVVTAHWFGFDDLATYIKYYEWAIGVKEADLESVQAYTAVGIMNYARAEGLSLEWGVEYVITVRAWDASGFSVTSTSDIFLVDVTPPVGVQCPEDDEPVVVMDDPAFDGTVWTLLSGQLTTDDSTSTTMMRGEITQTVTLEKHQIYSFTLFTTAPCSQGGFSRVKIDYAEVTLDLIPTLQAECEFYYRFVSQRSTEEAVLSVYSVEGLSITRMQLSRCSVDPEPSDNPIFIQMIGATDVEVQWYIDDRESNIRFYEFTLGTTPGGSQLAQISNMGIQNTVYRFNLPVSHNNSVYAMVIAHNRAGLETKFISSGAVVDWTPPILPTPTLNIFPTGGDQYIVQAVWQGTEDPETGVNVGDCSWKIGTSPGTGDLQDWLVVGDFSAGSESLALQDGLTVYATVQCRNGIFLSEYATSRPTIVAAGAPDVSAASFQVFVISRSGYSARDGASYKPDRIHVFFEGITDVVGIQYYSMRLTSSSGSEVIPWTPVRRQTDFMLSDLSLSPGEYTFSVKALSLSGLESAEASTIITFTDQPPKSAGMFGPASFVNESHITLSWSQGFSAQSGELMYDVNVGVMDNAAGVVSGLRTNATEATFSRKKIVPNKPFHVLIKAINAAGDFTIKKGDATAN